MAKKVKKKFSAFKLFYDEFIYKENDNISYASVERNIKKIRDLTMEVRKTSKRDLELYKLKLERNNKRIREQLDEIYNLNKAMFEYYFLLYKSCVEMCTDKLEDMPFIISCSFYDDYRLDNKTPSELENSSYAVPKYSSLEKKKIRNEAKGKTKLEYFVYLLKESDNRKLFMRFIERSEELLAVKPYINEGYDKFFERINKQLIKYNNYLVGIEEILKTTDDYEVVCDIMQIAYHKKFILNDDTIKEMVNLHFDEVYNRMKDDKSLRGQFNENNDISFETFKSLTDDFIKEKETLMDAYVNGKFEPVSFAEDSYITKFRELLINSFFDSRYQNKQDVEWTISNCVERAISLYSLAHDLENQIFERVMYDASHSPLLKRNNDVRSALIKKVYDLYNPFYLLSLYEKSKDEFLEIIKEKNQTFKDNFEIELNQKKTQLGYHGPIPTMKSIKTKVNGRRIHFIEEYCITELKSRDEIGDYDTRNYDLNVMIQDISTSDIVELYENMKIKIRNYNFENLCFFDEVQVQESYEREQLLIAAQELVTKAIYRNMKLKNANQEDLLNKYKDICLGYFNEKCLFIKEKYNDANKNGYNDFLKIRNKFNENSKWMRLLDYHKIKRRLL